MRKAAVVESMRSLPPATRPVMDALPTTGRRLLAYLRPYVWPHFAGALLCMVVYSGTAGAVPYLVRSLIDDIFSKRNHEMLVLLPALILATFTIRAAVNFGQAYLGEWVGERIVYDLRARLQEKVQHLPVSFFDRTTSAGIVSRVTSDVLLVRQALTEGAAAMIRDVTTLLVLVAVAFYLDTGLAVIAFIVLPIVIVPLQALSRRMRTLSHRGLDTLGGLSSLLQESVQGNRVVKAFGMEDYESRRFERENLRLRRLHMKAARIGAFTAPMTEVLSAVGIAAVLWYGGESVFAGGRTAGGFLAFMTALVLIYEPFKKLTRTNNIVQAGLGAAERVFALLDQPEEGGRGQDGLEVERFTDCIRFEGVCFAYGDQNVLSDVDLTIRCGQVVALVGPSGGGKSTIADLIPRFYEVHDGRITLDGIDIRTISLRSLRSLIAVVTQQTFLFNDSVRANIAYGNPGRNDEEIIAAARAANAHDFIEKLAAGYDTQVGEMGVQLSGGQRQRIAIARALLKDAPILILDEATSALDSESERLVQSAIERLMAGRTTLVIAHRLSTVRRADQIVVVADGRIVECGTHAELVAGGRLYQRLHELQLHEDNGHGDVALRA
ncbi:MAG TPA: ABC transporter transmembrane domain-containing protein [Candidatus Limnocylindrales bacterium]|nr:ABC transporter transmembrane domain-containing protein [Candidatus Limnocylindrales bacterium]